ncbi:helix-turn-helix domain-containing protein [Kitasatospora sp. NPDC059146]|uniref:helix-turn-helix domain-containing protein n=1 Tax=unclassified Kitasatospora TaxID=2633591 RepID=UPI00368C26D6
MNQILRCRWCRRTFTRPQRLGRTPSYCRARCQQEAERARKDAPADRSLDDLVSTLAREHLALARQLAQTADAVAVAEADEDVQAVLGLIQEAEESLEDLRAHAVLQARTRKLPWAAIGQLTGWAAGTARRRWDEAYAARRLAQREARSQRVQPANGTISGPATQPGTTPAPSGTGHRAPEQRQRSIFKQVPPAEPAAAPVTDAAEATDPADALQPVAAAKLASALSCLHRRSRRSSRELAADAGVSPSFISRVLAGERIPSWPVADALVRAAGGVPADIRLLWDAAHGILPERPFVATPQVAAEFRASLAAAMRGLHLAAFAPDPLTISDISRGRVSPEDAAGLLTGARVPDWPAVEAVLEVLRADPDFVLPLWERVQLVHRHHPYHAGPPADAFG